MFFWILKKNVKNLKERTGAYSFKGHLITPACYTLLPKVGRVCNLLRLRALVSN